MNAVITSGADEPRIYFSDYVICFPGNLWCSPDAHAVTTPAIVIGRRDTDEEHIRRAVQPIAAILTSRRRDDVLEQSLAIGRAIRRLQEERPHRQVVELAAVPP